MSFQATVSNYTRFVAEKFVLPTSDGQEGVLVLVNATFDTSGAGEVSAAATQRPIVLVDEYHDDPARSSVRYESQLALEKPFVDVLVRGHVYAPHGRPATEVRAIMRVGSLRKDLTATGDRFWRRGALGLAPSSPQPFDRLPLVYERAFGGTVDDHCYQQNPVGAGYKRARSADPSVETEVPNFEYPNDRVVSPSDTVRPAGFGVIGRGWQPRVRYAGTFDAAWLANRWPLLPNDFDPRHCQSAPSDQQLPAVAGGEPVALVNLSKEGASHFNLPSYQFAARFVYDRDRQTLPMMLDTVLVEPDEHSVTLTWRAAIVTRRSRGLLRKIIAFNPGAIGAAESAASVAVEG
jgi:hypothetical protein